MCTNTNSENSIDRGFHDQSKVILYIEIKKKFPKTLCIPYISQFVFFSKMR